MSFLTKPEPEFIQLLQRTASENRDEASVAMAELAKAIELPLREGIMVGDIASNIYERIAMPAGSSTEFPLDLISPGEENDFVAYVAPAHGRVPERTVEGDYVMVPTYTIANSIDWLLRYAREARWDVVARATQVLEAGLRKEDERRCLAHNSRCWC